MSNEEAQYISCDEIHKILTEIKHDQDIQSETLASFVKDTRENVETYKTERDNLNTKLDTNQEILESHIITEAPKLYAIQTKLNIALALVISACLFGLAGPNGLKQIASFITGSGIGADGIIAMLGFLIPLLVPLGNRLFVRVVSNTPVDRLAIMTRERK